MNQLFVTVHRIEDRLIKSRKFSLPGKKSLLTTKEWSSIIVDAAESPIERPKKTKNLRAASQQSLRCKPERIRVRVGRRKSIL